jgi:hypothetical protein
LLGGFVAFGRKELKREDRTPLGEDVADEHS